MDHAHPSPAHALHVLVARLDRAADRILSERAGLTYTRFLALLTIDRLGPCTQRAVADELAVSEPSASRILTSLSADGLVEVARIPGSGNRRTVTLTDKGGRLLADCSQVLEEAFASLADSAGIQLSDIEEPVQRLLAVLP
ncbi:MarR family winged helix-turn-helix transcriptional regulator [Aeromicrobium phragmitis]|uniref:MarR family winged helix-turn-helix transcriptional regulator n=1 Tax=Aeromicrobium phragmitis TaxID=2478914 RepID=UPI00140843A2|nr:MarR family winged helix-turn-helix transcriptional regulator [Aeromicrobium phragmitis]